VCVLFIDAVGSTPFSERADPETVRGLQSDFFASVRRVVRQYGGVVEKYIGDAAMVLFGAPVSTETDAVRCVRAGLDLQRLLARDGDRAEGWTFRVGIATGEALVDVAAAHDGGQAIVAGDVVNTAARLQAEAPPGGVLVCGTTRAATTAEIRYAAQAPIMLRGRTTPTEVWLALAPVQARLAPELDATAMVGRDHELDLLTSALRHVTRERTPRLVTVLGRAGIGKSRLVRELYHHAQRLADVRVCWRSGRCPPFGEDVAYAALADIVKAQAGVLATDTPDAAHQRLDVALQDLVPVGESARLSDALRPLLGLPGSPLSTEDAETAWRRFLLALAERGPTVLVFEDLHWADERMLRFIELLSGTVRDVPLFVVCTARPELLDREPSWAGALPGLLAISLTPLRDDSIAALYAQLLGDADLPPDLLRPLVELADGMPLYALEYARMLVERGTLRQADRAWVIEPNDDLPMPESVHAVIANRLDLLDAGERAVLQAAAVVGPRFWPAAVSAALNTGADGVERALRTLEQRDLVRQQPESIMADEAEYRFRHGLVSDVCYERLPLAERIARHTRTADWLDTRLHSRGTELAEVVAHHRFTAYTTARALDLDPRPYAGAALAALRQAARRAMMLNAFDAASAHVLRASQLVLDTGAGAVSGVGVGLASADGLSVELLSTELAFHQQAAGFLDGPGPDRLTELASLLFQSGDYAGAARAWTLLGQIAWLTTDRAAALRCLDHAVELFDACPDTPEKAQAYSELGRLHMLNYEHEPALGATQVAADIAERLGLVELRANALITIGRCRYQAGEPDGLIDLQQALEFCRTYQLPSLGRATQEVAYALREEGERDQSDQVLTEGRLTAGGGLVVDHSYDAMQALLAGDWDRFLTEADAILHEPAAESAKLASRPLVEWELQIRAVRGWLRALRGDTAAAAEDSARALTVAQASGFWRLRWTALAHGALCHAVLGQHADAGAMLRELADGHRRMRTIASGEWVTAAAHAAVHLGAVHLGSDAAQILRSVLMDVPHHTPWSRAAQASIDGALASADGQHSAAAKLHLAAAEQYATIGSLTDRMLALGSAAAELAAAGDLEPDAPVRAELTEFATRNRAPYLSP
jgi:class 3 adenylate cyclase/tetratricopeptide (TPR) repeat protein